MVSSRDRSPTHGREVGTAAIVAMLVGSLFGGGLVWWSHSVTQTGQGNTTRKIADGPTFGEVVSTLNASAGHAAGGPWTLFSVYGVAAPGAFSPNLIGYPAGEGAIVNACGNEFDGTTLWNGTIPSFNGTYDSGTAPFWQLAYWSSSSSRILVTTDILNQTRTYAPISLTDPCAPWYDFGGATTSYWAGLSSTPLVDSTIAAEATWHSTLSASLTLGTYVTETGPHVEIMTTGPGVFMGFGDTAGWGVYFDRCGLAGIAGIQPLVLGAVDRGGTFGSSANLTHNCALIVSGEAAFDGEYDLLFSNLTVTSNSTSAEAKAGFQVAFALPNGTLGTDRDEVGLANWMTSWNLTDSAGQRLAIGEPSCRAWVPDTQSCSPSTGGWYAVLESASGRWLDSYGIQPGGLPGWSEPVGALVSGQQVVIVAPPSWDLTGDTLAPTCTVPSSAVIGSVAV